MVKVESGAKETAKEAKAKAIMVIKDLKDTDPQARPSKKE